MTIQELKKQIESGKAKKLYIFYGNENYMIRMYLNKLDEKFVRVGTLEQAMTLVNTVDMFARDKTYVVYMESEIPDEAIEVLMNAKFKHRLVLVVDAVDKRKAVFKKLDNCMVEFKKLQAGQLVKFIQDLLGADLSKEVAETIADRSNCDISRIELECDKLVRVGKPLTMMLVNDLVTPYPEDVVFDMINAVAKRQKTLAYKYYQDLIQLKTSPVAILTLLYRNFRGVLLVQGYAGMEAREVAAKTGMVIGQVYAIKNLVGAFTMQQLLDIMVEIEEADEGIKTGKYGLDMALEMVLLEILGRE